jgi:hypothetical protein
VIPPSVDFFTVHFDWFSHTFENVCLDLTAIDVLGRSHSLDPASDKDRVDISCDLVKLCSQQALGGS